VGGGGKGSEPMRIVRSHGREKKKKKGQLGKKKGVRPKSWMEKKEDEKKKGKSVLGDDMGRGRYTKGGSRGGRSMSWGGLESCSLNERRDNETKNRGGTAGCDKNTRWEKEGPKKGEGKRKGGNVKLVRQRGVPILSGPTNPELRGGKSKKGRTNRVWGGGAEEKHPGGGGGLNQAEVGGDHWKAPVKKKKKKTPTLPYKKTTKKTDSFGG